MDWSLLKQAIVANNIEAFTQIVEQNPGILQHNGDNDVVVVVDDGDDDDQSSNTASALHLATRHGHADLVAEILSRCPEMVGAENNKGETALHEACRLGHDRILAKLLETDPWVAPKLNFEGKSALYLACHHGRFKAAAIFLNQPWLQEQDDNDTFLHAAVAEGYIAIVRKVLETHPSAAQKLDKDGNSPLHCACSRGHAEITAMVLRHDPSLASGFNKSGYAPVHLAAMDGSTKVLKELFTMAPDCFQLQTRMGETVFHLTTKFDRLDAFLYLTHVVKSTGLLNQPDKNGVTCLQLAVSLGHDKIAEHIMEEFGEEIDSASTKNFLKEMLETSDAKRSTDPSSSTETTDLLKSSAGPKEDNIADSNHGSPSRISVADRS